MTSPVEAVPGHVFVLRDTEKREVTIGGGLVLVDQYAKRDGNTVHAAVGEVYHCGKAITGYDFQFEVGAKVLYNPYDAYEVQAAFLKGVDPLKTYDLVPFKSIMGVLSPGE